MSDFGSGGGILPMNDTTKYQAIGYISGANMDWLGGIYLQDDVYKGRCRLRVYKDSKVFDSDDDKECMALEDSNNRERQVNRIKKTLLVVKQQLLESGHEVNTYSFKEWEGANPEEVMDWMIEQPWCHTKNISQ